LSFLLQDWFTFGVDLVLWPMSLGPTSWCEAPCPRQYCVATVSCCIHVTVAANVRPTPLQKSQCENLRVTTKHTPLVSLQRLRAGFSTHTSCSASRILSLPLPDVFCHKISRTGYTHTRVWIPSQYGEPVENLRFGALVEDPNPYITLQQRQLDLRKYVANVFEEFSK